MNGFNKLQIITYSMKNTSLIPNSKEFNQNLHACLEKLRALPQTEKTDELSAPLYLHKNFLVRKAFIDRFKAGYSLTNYKDKTVLDYGCGSGMFLQGLSPEIKKGIGVDLDTEVASKIISSPNITLEQIKNEQEISKFSNIDIITSFDVLEHIQNLDPLLDLFKKLLVPGGVIIISGPTENSIYRLARKITRLGLKGRILGEEEHVSNIVDIKRKLVEQGFVIEKNINQWNLFHITRFRVNDRK